MKGTPSRIVTLPTSDTDLHLLVDLMLFVLLCRASSSS